MEPTEKQIQKLKPKKLPAKMDIISRLTENAAYKVFMQLSPDALVNLWNVKRWRYHMDDYFWLERCKKDGYWESEDLESQRFQQYLQRFSCHWEGVYMYRKNLQSNWENKAYKKITKECESAFNDIIYFDEDILIATTRENFILVIDSCSGSIKKTFYAEDEIIQVLKFDEVIVVQFLYKSWHLNLSACNTAVKAWNFKTGKCLIYTCLTVPYYYSLAINKNFFGCLVEENRLRIFDLNTKKGQMLVYKRNSVVNVCCNSDIFAFSGSDGSKEILNSKFALLVKLECCRNKHISKMKIEGDYLLSYCNYDDHNNWENNYHMCMYNLKTKQNIIIENYFSKLYFLPESKLLTFTYSENTWVVKMWDANNGNCLTNIQLTDAIWNSLEVQTNGLYVSGTSYWPDDRFLFNYTKLNYCYSIEIFCTKTGKCIGNLKEELVRYDVVRKLKITKTKLAFIAFAGNVATLCILNYDPAIV